MQNMSDDFYEDDEPMEDVRAAWNNGEPGVTTGKKDLNQRAKSIVDRAVERLDAEDAQERPRLWVVSVGTAAGEAIEQDLRVPAPASERTETEKVEISV